METYNNVAGCEPVRRATKTKVWVNYRHLCRAATRLTEENARQIKRGVLSFTWSWSDNEVNVNSIGERERQRYGIPDNERLLVLVNEYKTEEAQQKQTSGNGSAYNAEVDAVFNMMRDAFYNHHTHYNKISSTYNLNKDNCKLFAQRWAVWQWITENYNRSKNSLTIFQAAYNMVFPGHLCDVNSFSNFKKAVDLKGIESKIIDGRAINKAAKRITSFQYALLQSLYIQPQKITAPSAHKKLIAACEGLSEKPYSLASVKLYFREFENSAELYEARYGAGAAQKQLPHATLLVAQHRNTQHQIDGWTMPFWGAQFQRYVLYIVRDNHSRKIVGYSVGESENTTLILAGLEDAMRNTGCFPGELVSDKHSFHQTQIATRLKAETERMGAVWTITINAQRNQLAERYNQYLDALCKDFPGYTGKNITARGKDARPSPEALAQLAKTANFKTFEEIRAIAAYIVKEFNKTPLTVLGDISPNEAYAASEDRKCFAITEAERISLLRPAIARKVVKGQITIKVGIKKHEFQLPANLISKYNNRELHVVYEDLEQGIYVSDVKSGEELGSIAPKPKIHGAIPDQTDKDRQLIHKLTGKNKGVKVPARKAAQAKIAEALQHNPDAIELINHYSIPKDIRQLAAQDNELKRAMNEQGVSFNNLPIRSVKAAAIELPAPTVQKTKSAPFTSAVSDMSRMSIDDLVNGSLL